MSDAEPPLDGDDQIILDRLAVLHDVLDPPPADLDTRVQFAIGLADLEVEVARLGTQLLEGSGARGTERTRTLTFDSDSRTIMVSIVEHVEGGVRLDGWLAPAAALRVELRRPEPAESRVVTSDQSGRFTFDRVPHGLAQLLVHPAGEPGRGTAPRVVTSSFSA